jgi:hypothetical protein
MQKDSHTLSSGLGELVEPFKQSRHGETTESWVGTGPNKPVTPTQLEQAIGLEVLETLSKQTGLCGKSCSRGCPTNSPTLLINTRRKADFRRKRIFPEGMHEPPARLDMAYKTGT